jgi:hypothetical protein
VGKIAVLLGAGASVDAGLPTSTAFTEKLTNHFKGHYRPEVPEILNFVSGLLLGERGAQGRDPYDGVDVEKVMTAIELLGDRRELEIAPFVFSWHPRVAELDSGSMPAFLMDKIRKGVLEGRSESDLAAPLRTFVEAVVRTGSDGRRYKVALRAITAALVELLGRPVGTAYLRPVVELGRQDWVAVATLNYDRTIEIESERLGVICATAVEEWVEHGEWIWPAAGVRLLKLHGSIDWEVEQRRTNEDVLAQYRIHVVGPAETPKTPAVIFGGRNKLRAEGPFLELLAEFEKMVRSAEGLVVVGYSFRDEHVNEILKRWINNDSRRRIVAVDPSFPDRRGAESSFAEEVRAFLAGRPERPEFAGRPGSPGHPQVPGIPKRFCIVKKTARDGLAEALVLLQEPAPWEADSL